MNTKKFDREPDYIFGTDELDTVLLWPESTEGLDPYVHARTILESGEIVDRWIFGHDIDEIAEDYEGVLADLLPSELYYTDPADDEQ